MKKTTVDNISLILLILAIISAAFTPKALWILILCLFLCVTILILNLIGYFTKYTEEQKKACQKSLFLLLAGALFALCILFFQS